jgi:glycosyltransferase involved in cell wall biosynthesis
LALIEIYRFIKRNNIDIVHTHSSKAGILGRCAARFARVNFIIHTVHGWSFNDYQPGFIRYIFIGLERLAAQFTHKLIVVSYYDKQKGLINRIGREDKYIIIRYGIDYTEFFKKDQKIKEELGIDNADLVVTMISCLKPQKSPQDFVKLAFLVNRVQPDIKFLLVGDGILRRRTQELIDSFNLEKCVILTGWRRDICRILSATDVFVLTSLWEGLPIVVLEAAASSIPAVATHTGGIAEAISDGKTGFLIPSRNLKLMSERLALLLKDESLRRQMGENAKNKLGPKFMLTNMVKDTQNLYDSLFEAKN